MHNECCSVSWTATDAIKMGYKVKLVTDAIRGIYPGVPRNADDQEPESAVEELLTMLEAEGVE
jgi:nicotinamidase-related amidase